MGKSILFTLMALALMMCPMSHLAAQEIGQDAASLLEPDTVATRNDTVYFYDTWQQMFNMQPAAMFTTPDAEVYSISEIYIRSDVDSLNDIIQNLHIALSVSDSIWLVNCDYLKKHFKVEYKNIQRYNQVFFTEKAAFFIAYAPLTVIELLNGNTDDTSYQSTVAFYYIDFKNRRVDRVNHKYLSKLLADYHDLQMRYEGMKDYKKPHVIQDFLFRYLDRASEDTMRPSIPDLIAAWPVD